MKYHLGNPRIGCRHNIVVLTNFLSNVRHLIFYQCIIVPRLHLLVALLGPMNIGKKGDKERFFVKPSLSKCTHPPSGPAVVVQTIDTWAQIRVQSKVTWVLQLVEYSSDSSRNCSKKVTTKSADNQSVQKSLFTYLSFIVLEKSEFWFPEAVKAPAWFLSLVCFEVKWQFRDWNDSLTH